MSNPQFINNDVGAPTFSEVEALCNQFEGTVLPAAKRLGLCARDARPQDFYSRISTDHGVTFKLKGHKPSPAMHPKKKARNKLNFLAFGLCLIAENRIANVDDPSVPDACATIRYEMYQLIGYMEAISDINAKTSRPAAKGRRKIGDITRERVRAAVARLERPTSKERAAVEIAQIVGLEASSVRRRLTELFPGPAWPPKG